MRHFGIATALLLTPALPAAAQGVGADRLARFSEQLDLLDSRAATQYEYSARLQPGAGGDEEDTAIPRYTGRYAGPWLEVARAAARRHRPRALHGAARASVRRADLGAGPRA